MLPTAEELSTRYSRLIKQVWMLNKYRGLSAAIYTQTTDVETECNGLLTYDRAVAKIKPEEMVSVNRGIFSGPEVKYILADALAGRTKWKYTFEKPPDNWNKPEFDASTWSEGPAGFGTERTPGSFPNTVWNTSDIWLRNQFTLEPEDKIGLKLRVYHDEDTSIYLNGVLALELKGFVTEYEEFDVPEAAAAALHPGNNTIAVTCHQTTGGQGIDVGILVQQKPKAQGDAKGD